MDAASLARLIELERTDAPSLDHWGVVDHARARKALAAIVDAGMPLDLLAGLCDAWAKPLAATGDADRVLDLFARFVAASRSPLALGALFEREPDSLVTLLKIFAASQDLGEILALEPESFDLVRMTQGRPVPRADLMADAVAEVDAVAGDDRAVLATIRRFKRRETLRIAYGDLIGGQDVETVSRQLAHLADGLIHAAVHVARQGRGESKAPSHTAGRSLRFAVVALGRLGGQEPSYASDVELMFVHEPPPDPARRAAVQEHFDRVAKATIRLLDESTVDGVAYRVDTRLRPGGPSGALSRATDDALAYYDVLGRTWERQTLIQARAVAGDVDLGEEFLARLAPWIWRRYLGRADIGGLKALRRRIERRWRPTEDDDERELAQVRGALRDVEDTVQFLQLLNGGDWPAIRVGGVFEAMRRLEAAGCLTARERSELAANHALLRTIEHRAQVASEPASRSPAPNVDRAAASDRGIPRSLLRAAFPHEESVEPATDLILDPDPSPRAIATTLAPYRFADPVAAFQNLSELGDERVRFLSTRRCRHFLATIAPKLLEAVGATSDPDFTLANLARVSDSLGGKGALWESFGCHPPTLRLYVRLCGASAYLSDILTGSPGMLDELLDSLSLGRLPDRAGMTALLAEWTRAANDPTSLLHGFKESMHLCVGVRESLGKDDWTATHAALSDVAETILSFVVEREHVRLVERWGEPIVAEGPRRDAPCGAVVLALGKLGGREIDYRSDLDLAFLYDGDGSTRQPPSRAGKATTTNADFFQQLAQRTMRTLSNHGPLGKLYEVDPRLRPGGAAGPLALSTSEFARRHAENLAPFWERLALCQARPVHGDKLSRIAVSHSARQALARGAPTPEDERAARESRRKLEHGAGAFNLKRAPGGTADVELLVRLAQVRRAVDSSSAPIANTLGAIDALAKQDGAATTWRGLRADYSLLRQTQSAMRLVSSTARNDLPEDRRELGRIAWLLGRADVDELTSELRAAMDRNRARIA